jgi:hypothetical protein
MGLIQSTIRSFNDHEKDAADPSSCRNLENIILCVSGLIHLVSRTLFGLDYVNVFEATYS